MAGGKLIREYYVVDQKRVFVFCRTVESRCNVLVAGMTAGKGEQWDVRFELLANSR